MIGKWFVFPLLFTNCLALKLRVLTWNVADNKEMQDGFTVSAIDNVLSLSSQVADIYAIGLQEQCWNCNVKNFAKIAQKFLDRILLKDKGFAVVHVEGTRESNWCQVGCKVGSHGTTLLMVIARKHLVKSLEGFHRNDGCSSAFIENDEKGVAALKLQLTSGKKLCLASTHLDSKSPNTRRSCLKSFFSDAERKVDWVRSCDYHFLFGDFNTRTGDKGSGNTIQQHRAKASDYKNLQILDEMRGTKPYGTTSSWKGNLLQYINSVQATKWTEGRVAFVPTYSILPEGHCGGLSPCYKPTRPASWTDRILFSNGKLISYQAVTKHYGDHFPVNALFDISA